MFCPPGRGKKEERAECRQGLPPTDETFAQTQRRKVRKARVRVHYRRRKAIVEPVFGQMKETQGSGGSSEGGGRCEGSGASVAWVTI